MIGATMMPAWEGTCTQLQQRLYGHGLRWIGLEWPQRIEPWQINHSTAILADGTCPNAEAMAATITARLLQWPDISKCQLSLWKTFNPHTFELILEYPNGIVGW